MEPEGSATHKTLTIFLAVAPYAGEQASTAMRLARAAINAGHRVNIFASADGVYGFTLGHRAKGLPSAETGFGDLIAQGAHVELCGSCLATRGVRRENLLPDAGPSSLERLFRLIRESDVLLTLGG